MKGLKGDLVPHLFHTLVLGYVGSAAVSSTPSLESTRTERHAWRSK